MLIINTEREAYGAEDIVKKHGTMTVGELIEYLEQFDYSTPVVLSFDNGYTYGSITESKIEDSEDEE